MITTAFILIVTVAVVLFDVYLVWDTSDRTPTISRVIYESARKYPLIPLAWGILMGHWFWSICPA